MTQAGSVVIVAFAAQNVVVTISRLRAPEAADSLGSLYGVRSIRNSVRRGRVCAEVES